MHMTSGTPRPASRRQSAAFRTPKRMPTKTTLGRCSSPISGTPCVTHGTMLPGNPVACIATAAQHHPTPSNAPSVQAMLHPVGLGVGGANRALPLPHPAVLFDEQHSMEAVKEFCRSAQLSAAPGGTAGRGIDRRL